MGGKFTFTKVLKVTWLAVSLGIISLEVVIALFAGTIGLDEVVNLFVAIAVLAYWLGTLLVRSESLSWVNVLVVWASTAGTVLEELLSGEASSSFTSLGVLLLGVLTASNASTIGLVQYLIVFADILDAALLSISISECSNI